TSLERKRMFRGLDIEFFGGKIQKNHRNLAIFLNTSNQKMESHHLASYAWHSVAQSSKKIMNQFRWIPVELMRMRCPRWHSSPMKTLISMWIQLLREIVESFIATARLWRKSLTLLDRLSILVQFKSIIWGEL
ncbi:MAG: hypothetical protein AABZ02_06585, partial [Bacteroidota bacterium]